MANGPLQPFARLRIKKRALQRLGKTRRLRSFVANDAPQDDKLRKIGMKAT